MASNPNLSDTDYELLSAYIDGALSDSERSALEARLQDDLALQYELTALRQTVALINQLPKMIAPRDFTLTPEMVGIRLVDKPRRPLIFPTLQVVSAVAAMVMIVFSVGLFLTTNGDSNKSASDNSVALQSEPLTSTDESEVAFANTGELSTEERLTQVAIGTQSAQESRGITANPTQSIPSNSTLLTLTAMAQEVVESEEDADMDDAGVEASQFVIQVSPSPEALIETSATQREADLYEEMPATGGAGGAMPEDAQQAEAEDMADTMDTLYDESSAVGDANINTQTQIQATPSPMRTSLPTMQSGMDDVAPSAPEPPTMARLQTATPTTTSTPRQQDGVDGTVQDTSNDDAQSVVEQSTGDEVSQSQNEVTITVESTEEALSVIDATPTLIAPNESELRDSGDDDDNTPLAILLLIGGIALLAGVFISRWVLPRRND